MVLVVIEHLDRNELKNKNKIEIDFMFLVTGEST